MPASTYAGNLILNHFLRGVALTPPTDVYISLHTGDPGLAGANEVTLAAWPAYVRKRAAAGGAIAAGFAAPAGKSSANLIDLLYPANNGAAPVIVTHFGIWDAATGGNLFFQDILSLPKTINPTDEMMNYAGSIVTTVT